MRHHTQLGTSFSCERYFLCSSGRPGAHLSLLSAVIIGEQPCPAWIQLLIKNAHNSLTTEEFLAGAGEMPKLEKHLSGKHEDLSSDLHHTYKS